MRMPTRAKKPKGPVAPLAPTLPSEDAPLAALTSAVPPDGLPVLYDRLEITEYSTTSPKGPLTVERMKRLLGWETESEYVARKLRENPGTAPEQWMADPKKKDVFGDVYHCRNLAGEKVRCNNNAHNRPFDVPWGEKLTHTVLYGQWAGPHTVPGETVNGETVRVSRYGRVLSGQHQMTGAINANDFLHKYRKEHGLDSANAKYPAWAKHNDVFIETIVITGMSEDPRVLMTVDYVRPRTSADVFYTSDVFKALPPPDREELCRMLAAAVDLLWTRTATRGYRTHPEVVAFLDRHRTLLRCVEHLFGENRMEVGRRVSKLRLNAGACAALCYLMAAGATRPEDSDAYRNMEPPSEEGVDLSLLARAEDFWTLLAGGADFAHVRTALAGLANSTPGSTTNRGLGGTWPERLAVLAAAWGAWRDHPAGAGPPFDAGDLAPGGLLCLNYNDRDDRGNALPDGQIKLLEVADLLGIDCPEVVAAAAVRHAPDPPAPPPADLERLKEEARARRAQPSAG